MPEHYEAAVAAALNQLDAIPSVTDHSVLRAGTGPYKTVTQLASELRQQPGSVVRLQRAVIRMRSTGSQGLILWLGTATEPLVLWALHLELDRRQIPPCLRWPANDATLQNELMTWLADMYWFTKRNPAHEPRYRGWRGLFSSPPASAKWHAAAVRQFFHIRSSYSVSHWCSNGMNLTAAQRQELMTLPTTAMGAARRSLRADEFAGTNAALLSHAIAHPDRSGTRSAESVAHRRASLLRVHILSGKSPTATAMNWKLLSGETISRQAVAKQIDTIDAVLAYGTVS
jgi:hypothetical protein